MADDLRSESDDVLVRLNALTDADLLAVVIAATAGRPALAPVRAAASALAGGGAAPPDPSRPVVPPEVPPPLTMSAAPVPDDTDAGVPTFDRVRDRIEERFGTALGSEDLERTGSAGRDLDEQWHAREKAGRDRLEEIRRSMKRE